jgi:HSP20 family molecular chaperone IbpA
MPANKDGDRTPDDSHDGTTATPTGLLDQLRSLLKALAEIDSEEAGHRRRSGQIDRGSRRIEYEYTVSIGLGRSDHSRNTGSSPSRADSEHRSSSRRRVEDSVAIETRDGASDDEIVLVADLPGVADDDDVDVGINTDEQVLVLRVNGTEVERVPLAHSEMEITEMTINNQVLEVHALHASDSSRGETT